MMDTPVCDFVRRYMDAGAVRMHMPGHKGVPGLGPEAGDITEIEGADELYAARGIIRESEKNAAALFGAARTVYSAEGSSLCIRAMLYLARLRAAERGLPFRVLAGRNAHKALISAAALLDLEVDWIPSAEGLLSGAAEAEAVARALDRSAYMAVYLTTPDYLGGMADVRGIAEACRAREIPLLVDNAHGAYLKFLEPDLHPMALGADLCCDSAHKTLPCLTGAAYLHLSENAPEAWREQAEQAMELFASTSPSWLVLQSLDRANALLSGDYPERLRRAAERTQELKRELAGRGWRLIGTEPMKLAVAAGSIGYTGTELRTLLRAEGIVCEFADPDFLVLMPSPENTEEDWRRLEKALRGVPQRPPVPSSAPPVPRGERVMSIREALLAPRLSVPVSEAEGQVLADAYMGCPPAVPVLTAGERVTRDAILCFEYYGVTTCMVVRNGEEKP